MTRVSSLLVCGLLGGCVVGPDYRPPIPASEISGVPSYLPSDIASPTPAIDAWWTLYHDPTLDRLVDRALLANTQLRAAQADFEAARAVLHVARAARLPTTDLSVGGTYGRSTVSDQIADAAKTSPEDAWLYETGFDAAYEFDLFGRVRRSIEASGADADAAGASRDAVRMAIISETVRDYSAACAIGSEMVVARQAAALAEQERDIIRWQAEAGGATRFDLARQETLLAEAKASIPSLQGKRQASLFALADMLGSPPDGIPSGAEACLAPPEIRRTVPVGDGGALIARRPDIRLAERRMASASARIGIAKADLLPRISLLGSISSVAPGISALGTRTASSFGFGPFVSWSFPNLAAAKGRLRQARATDRAAIADYDGAILTALKEVEQALARYSGAIENEHELDLAAEQARYAFKLAQDRLAAGSISKFEALEAERALVTAETAVAAADTDRVDLLVSLFQALGGGWQPNVAPEDRRDAKPRYPTAPRRG